MRHRVYGRKLNRDSKHRRAMFRNLAAALFEHGEIRTTMARAKAVQPLVERIITIAKRGTLQSRREIASIINDRHVFSWIADPAVKQQKKDGRYFDLPAESEIEFNRYGELRKAPRLVHHIMTKVAPLFADRDGGYTRIIKLDARRLGDGADYVLLQMVGQEEGPQIGGRKSTRRAIADRRTAYAAKLRKGAGDEKKAAAKSEEPATVAGDAAEPSA
jgi:large subunit ribosomal protein L17